MKFPPLIWQKKNSKSFLQIPFRVADRQLFLRRFLFVSRVRIWSWLTMFIFLSPGNVHCICGSHPGLGPLHSEMLRGWTMIQCWILEILVYFVPPLPHAIGGATFPQKILWLCSHLELFYQCETSVYVRIKYLQELENMMHFQNT